MEMKEVSVCQRKSHIEIIFFGILIMIVSLVITWNVYPFIGTADGFNRWGMAIEICENGKILKDMMFSPIIPYIQAFFFFFTHSYASYTVFQCFFFYLGLGFLANYLLGNKILSLGKVHIHAWLIASLIALCIPTVHIFPAILTDSALIFPLISIEIWIADRINSVKLCCLIEMLLIALTVAIRVNSLVLFSCCIVVIILVKKKKALLHATFVIVSCIAGVLLPLFLMPISYNAISLGMTWELVGIVSGGGNEDLAIELGKYGDMEEAMERYNDDFLNAIVWDNNPPFPAKKIAREYARDIMKLYMRTAVSHPISFWKNKLHFISRALGLNAPLLPSSRGIYGVGDGTTNYITQCNTRKLFFSTTDRAIVTMRPWLMICIALIVSIIISYLAKTTGFRYWLVLFHAVSYYLSFLINTQAHEYRYYAPSFYLMLILVICALLNLCTGREINICQNNVIL